MWINHHREQRGPFLPSLCSASVNCFCLMSSKGKVHRGEGSPSQYNLRDTLLRWWPHQRSLLIPSLQSHLRTALRSPLWDSF